MVIVRHVPSPTGVLHIGTLRTMLYNYLFAKKHNGTILFRSEDTDKERSKKEYEDNIVSGAKNMGLLDENALILRQSERTAIYTQHLQKLLDEKKAYYCFMTTEEREAERKEQEKQGLPPRYSGKFRDYPQDEALKRIEAGERAVIRFKVPENISITFNDIIRGENTVNTKELDDFVIAKDLTTPLYNFCVVVDDHLMGVTHVIRGEDHIPNTPKQILIYKAFSWDAPEFAHLPLILNEDKTKLSKRKNKVSVDDYLDAGYLKEALLNFLVLIGWNPGTEEEIFSLSEMVEKFQLEKVHKGGAVFDIKKLDWLNGVYIRKFSIEELLWRLQPFLQNVPFAHLIKEKGEEFLQKAVKASQEKMKKLSEIGELIGFFYVFEGASAGLICNEKMKVDSVVAKKSLEEAYHKLSLLPENEFDLAHITEALMAVITENNLKNGQVLWPVRAALTGVPASPGAFEVAEILGKEETLKRLLTGVQVLS